MTGALLFAPCMVPAANADVTISTAQTENMTCGNGVCAPTARTAVLNASDLENLLASGDVEVTTTGSRAQASNIEVAAALSWSTTSALALDAEDSIAVNAAIAVRGQGGLTFTSAATHDYCSLIFGRAGSARFADLSSQLTINNTSYTLVNNVKSLALAIRNNPSGAYALAHDFDASHDGTYANSPVGTPLTGTVEGLGNRISNLSIDDKQKVAGSFGMFTAVEASGVIDNLRLSRINYTGSPYLVVGGLVAGSDGLLCGDQVAGSIQSGDSAGGLAFVNSQADNGNELGRVISSSANVHVVARFDGGGLVVLNEGSIQSSHASGDVATHRLSGGLAARNGGVIIKSYATGEVSGRLQTGGLVGYNLDSPNAGEITDSYATGAVKGAMSGGLMGEQNEGSFAFTSYATGTVPNGNGGFVCDAGDVRFLDDYWDVTTSGATFAACAGESVADVAGLTTEELKSGLPVGFDRNVWTQKPGINHGYPYLIDNPPE